jgi:hypothetical protein
MEFPQTETKLPGYIYTRNIKIKNDSETERNFSIQFADTNYLSHSEHNDRKYHSVIFSEPEHQLLSVFPKIPYPSTEIIETYSSLNRRMPQYVIQEIIEGIRIHLFYDRRTSEWTIATKRVIGGDHYPVYDGEIVSDLTYKQMFLDAVPDMFSPAMVGVLSIDHCYHFILQHPKLPQTSHIQIPAVYLVEVFHIHRETNTATVVRGFDSPTLPLGILLPKYILIPLSSTEPMKYTYSSVPIVYANERALKEAIKIVASPEFNNGCSAGWYVKTWDATMPFTDIFECILENAEYKNKRIREQSDVKYYLWKYLSLLRTNKIHDYIKWNPYFMEVKQNMYNLYNDFQKQLYAMYIEIYVKKTTDGTEFTDRKQSLLKSYTSEIHKTIYVPRIRYYKKNGYPKDALDIKIKMRDINKYLMKLDPKTLADNILL